MQAISELAGLDDHQPDLDVRPGGVPVWLNTITDDYYGLITCEVELAQQISAVARRLCAAADPSAVQTLVIPIDALVIADLLPFLACRARLPAPRRHPRHGAERPAQPLADRLLRASGRAAAAAQPDPHGQRGLRGHLAERRRPADGDVLLEAQRPEPGSSLRSMTEDTTKNTPR